MTRVIHRVGLWCVRLFYVGWVLELLSQARRDAAECAAAPAWAVADQELATTIAATLADLPADLGREIIDKAEAMLVDWAADFDPVTLGALGTRILEHVAPEVAEQREADLLARQQARAHRKRGFTLSPLGNGQVRLSGYLDVTGAATVSAALDPLCHPRHDPAEARTPAQRRADALVDICNGVLRGGTDLPGRGGDPAQVVVTIPYAVLTDQLRTTEPSAEPATESPAESPAEPVVDADASNDHGRAADTMGRLDTGALISAAEARRMACDAQVLPAVLGGDGQVLDLGRTRRLFTGPLRRALTLRDHGCAFPECDRPARWSEAHHLVPWAQGGTTELANACLICRRHHRLLHNGSGWRAQLGPDGHPEFVPPASIDPERRPRRNTFHRRQ